ncbi:hypothetical protein AMAG_18780 [Allomyces macrogynus ATCC 38327]|uniref:Dilute domain-containing protein n=1 Tax=Allomyces macrogynus (strain ATCC 38327) TaxID=578462 RepID=A0A0L0SH60_ALLM3|nr:hypothetical protein AMAG_18780 [Allomyces macrogynus ATCC 38327]|eukprot:KNE61848.1 hypothetical protein AMAG_18780 [Allomyces macrogynus ATCC 38327]
MAHAVPPAPSTSTTHGNSDAASAAALALLNGKPRSPRASTTPATRSPLATAPPLTAASPALSPDIKKKLQAAFVRACAAGDLRKVSYLLKHCAEDVPVDTADETGSTGLMQAACFGHANVVKRLLEAGADADLQDNNGWTALMWATNNNQAHVVELLLDRGVDADVRSVTGKTVRDFLERAHLPRRDQLASIFYSDTRSIYTRNSSDSGDAATSVTSMTSDSYYVPSLYGVDYREMCDIVGTTVPAALAHITQNGSSPARPPPPIDGDESGDMPVAEMIDPQAYMDEEDEALVEFDWDACPPDQMLVFSETSLPALLHVAIKKLADPAVIRSHNNNPAGYTRRPVSANVLFLAARYAGYYASQELLDTLFSQALDMLEQTLRPRRHDMMFLGYWLSNCSRLLYCLKKDAGLVVATLPYQVRLNELIQDIFMALLRDAQQRIAAIVDEALLSHDTIEGWAQIKYRERTPSSTSAILASGFYGSNGVGAASVNGVASNSSSTGRGRDGPMALRRAVSSPNFANGSSPPKLSGINRLSSYFSSSSSVGSNTPAPGLLPPSPHHRKHHRPQAKKTPRTVTTILSSTLYVLQTFHIHPSLVHQAIEQLFFYIGASTFNRLLSRPELCCRWKAMQIRMNLSHLEDWVRSNPIPAPSRDTFTKHLQPVISMLQLLQIITHFRLLSVFREALRESGHMAILNWSQVRRAMDLYTYEADENEIAPEIAQYVVDGAARAAEAAAAHRAALRDVDDSDDESLHAEVTSPATSPATPAVDRRRRSVRRPSLPDSIAATVEAHRAAAAAAAATKRANIDSLPDPLASPPPIDEFGRVIPPSPPTPAAAGAVPVATRHVDLLAPPPPRRQRRPSAVMERIKGPVVAVAAMDPATGDAAYMYYMLDEKYWLPFAVPTNVGERIVVRIDSAGDEKYCEEVPVLAHEIVDMLDNFSWDEELTPPPTKRGAKRA